MCDGTKPFETFRKEWVPSGAKCVTKQSQFPTASGWGTEKIKCVTEQSHLEHSGRNWFLTARRVLTKHLSPEVVGQNPSEASWFCLFYQFTPHKGRALERTAIRPPRKAA